MSSRAAGLVLSAIPYHDNPESAIKMMPTPTTPAMNKLIYRKPKAPFILIPLYIYPLRKGETWAPLFQAVKRYPDLSFVVIVNPASGPGRGPVPDENYLAVLTKLLQFSNVTIMGYVAVCWAQREYDEVVQDVCDYYQWEKNVQRKLCHNGIPTIRIDGIFFDEAPSKETQENVKYMSSAATLARSLARSSDRSWNNRPDYRHDPDDETSRVTTRTDNNHHQSQAPSPPCTIIYNPGTPPSHQSPFFDSSQADYIVIFEQTLATWPTGTEPEDMSLKKPLPECNQDLHPSLPPSGSSSTSSSSSPSRSTSNPFLASDPNADAYPDPNEDQVPEPDETEPVNSDNRKGREYIASCLAALSPAERAKSIAIAHSVLNLEDQLRFATKAVEYGLAGHFATSTGDYSSWSGSFGEGDCTILASRHSSSSEGEVISNSSAVSSSHWLSYAAEANKLASCTAEEQTSDRPRQ
ncbi:Spherulation-specific family 4 domain containing protein [Naviculisporaceae sp. PSN 640]